MSIYLIRHAQSAFNAVYGPNKPDPMIFDAPSITVKKPALIELHHADPTTAALYSDVRQTLGLPFVNTDYRAFARWPSYFDPAWTDLRSIILRLSLIHI